MNWPFSGCPTDYLYPKLLPSARQWSSWVCVWGRYHVGILPCDTDAERRGSCFASVCHSTCWHSWFPQWTVAPQCRQHSCSPRPWHSPCFFLIDDNFIYRALPASQLCRKFMFTYCYMTHNIKKGIMGALEWLCVELFWGDSIFILLYKLYTHYIVAKVSFRSVSFHVLSHERI